MSLEDFIAKYDPRCGGTCVDRDACDRRHPDARAALAELAQLRARLAAAEAVIAALPRCEKCGEPATWESDSKVSVYGCDACMEIASVLVHVFPYAAPLRAWLALVGEEKTS